MVYEYGHRPTAAGVLCSSSWRLTSPNLTRLGILLSRYCTAWRMKPLATTGSGETDHINTLVSLAKLCLRRIRSPEGRQWHSHRSLLKISLVAFNLAHQSSACLIPSLLISEPALLLFLVFQWPLILWLAQQALALYGLLWKTGEINNSVSCIFLLFLQRHFRGRGYKEVRIQ